MKLSGAWWATASGAFWPNGDDKTGTPSTPRKTARASNMAAGKKTAPRAKPGRKPARQLTEKQIGQAFLGLRREMDAAEHVAKTGVAPPTSPALDAAVLAYARATDPQGWVRSSLAYAAARLALGHPFADVVKPGLLPVDVKLTPKLVAAIERKQHETPLGKALAVYRLIAKGHDEVPTRREPTGELKRLLEWRLSQFTD